MSEKNKIRIAIVDNSSCIDVKKILEELDYEVEIVENFGIHDIMIDKNIKTKDTQDISDCFISNHKKKISKRDRRNKP